MTFGKWRFTRQHAWTAVFGIAGFFIMPGGSTVRGLVAGILLALAGAMIEASHDD